MSEVEFQISPEELQELREACEIAVKMANEIINALTEVFQRAMDIVREFGINLARFFLKLQLLEWKIPYPLADLISKNLYWYWAMRLGFNWLERKFSLIE